MTFALNGCREDSSLLGATGSAEVRWEPTLSAMGARSNLARCRGIADKVGSHQSISWCSGRGLPAAWLP